MVVLYVRWDLNSPGYFCFYRSEYQELLREFVSKCSPVIQEKLLNYR